MTMQNGVWTGGLHTLRCHFETTYSTATTLDQISFHPPVFLFTLWPPAVIGPTKPGIAGSGAKWHLNASQSLQLGINRPVALGRNR